jgi:hypothetical protein
MRKSFLLAALTTVLALAGCDKAGENERITNFYLSQPRDPELVGWWADVSGAERDAVFHWYRADGVVLSDLKYYNGAIDLRGQPQIYWYTNGNIFHWFHRNDSWKGWSPQATHEYEIRGDELWTTTGGDSDDTTLRLFAKRPHPRL